MSDRELSTLGFFLTLLTHVQFKHPDTKWQYHCVKINLNCKKCHFKPKSKLFTTTSNSHRGGAELLVETLWLSRLNKHHLTA